MSEQAPVTKYRLTVTIRGNTHAELMDELAMVLNGGFLLSSDYGKRDSFDSTGGRDRLVLEHTNPDQTPEAYAEELMRWSSEIRSKRTDQAARDE